MTFYQYSGNASYEEEWAFGWQVVAFYGPEPPRCPGCRRRFDHDRRRFDLAIDAGAVAWPDVLGNTSLSGTKVLSEKVLDDWAEAGITGYEILGPAPIVRVDAAALKKIEPPRYFRVLETGSIEYDLEKSGLRVVSVCPVCRRENIRPIIEKVLYPVEEAWDGSDICKGERIGSTCCSERVVELAARKGHTNFRFEPLGVPFDDGSPGVDYQGVWERDADGIWVRNPPVTKAISRRRKV